MNNIELTQMFKDIDSIGNCFEREIALIKANKRYKKSEFYKQTHYPIARAYTVFKLNGVNTLLSFANSKIISDLARGDIASLQAGVAHFIEGLDMEVFEEVFNSFAEKLMTMEGDNTALQNELVKSIKEFRSMLK